MALRLLIAQDLQAKSARFSLNISCRASLPQRSAQQHALGKYQPLHRACEAPVGWILENS
ncbi:hypothetical protein AB1I39_22955, partial [Chromobacterium vaccinii]|uniref:hypothetical protein n=1 Tax=Chromobacterium vaccinii TaxID=1108595 RepID=UPI00345A57FB